jgi:hypothetical protein
VVNTRVSNKMNDRKLSVRVLAGMIITTIAVELPVLAIPQPAPILVAQVACVVSKTTSVFRTANPKDPEVLPMRPLKVETAVVLAEPLPSVPPARVQIKPTGFVDYAALDCGRPTTPVTPSGPKTTACRKVRNTVTSMAVRRESSRGAAAIAAVGADQSVYITQTGGVTTARKDANGEVWVEVDLQRTFGRNFGISPSFGWLSNSEPNDSRSTLVNCK